MNTATAANAVVASVEQVCALYGVPTMREQSRTFAVPGEGGKQRPFFVGEWSDELGNRYRKGKADLLALPRVRFRGEVYFNGRCVDAIGSMVTPLWIECKAGSGRLSSEQKAFRDFILRTGGDWVLCHDSTDALIDWFELFGVRKALDRVAA